MPRILTRNELDAGGGEEESRQTTEKRCRVGMQGGRRKGRSLDVEIDLEI